MVIKNLSMCGGGGGLFRAQTQCIAAAGELHHRYACKHSGDVIHPQLRCIRSGHETRGGGGGEVMK